MKAQNYLYLMILLYAGLLLYLTLFLGSSTDGLFGSQPLFYERIIPFDSYPFYDQLGYGGHLVEFTPTIYILNFFSFISLDIFVWILLILLFGLLVFTLKKITNDSRIFPILVLFFSSPIFIISILSLSDKVFVFFFFLLFFLSLYNKKMNFFLIPIAFLIGQYGVGSVIVLLLVLFFNPTKKTFVKYLTIPLLLGFVSFIYLRNLTNAKLITTNVTFPIVEFGHISGMSLLLVLLTIVSAILYFGKISFKNYFYMVAITVFALFFSDLYLLVTLLFSLIGSYSLSVFFDKKWSSLTLHISSLLMILFIFVFSQIFIFQAISLEFNEQPAPIFIDDVMINNSLVFSSQDAGYYIESQGFKSFWNDNSETNLYPLRRDLYNQIISNYSVSGVSTLLESQNIRYLYITPSMKNDVKEYLSNGLFLPLNDNETFTLISSKGDYELYEFIS